MFALLLLQICLHLNLYTYSSPSLLNECFWYDKLWGPSQRVVTLLLLLLLYYYHYYIFTNTYISDHRQPGEEAVPGDTQILAAVLII